MSFADAEKNRNGKSVKIKLSVVRLVALVLGVMVLLGAMLLTACASSSSSEVEEEVRAKVVSNLTAIRDNTSQELGAEINRLDQEITSLNGQMDRLNQVVAPALEWLQVQKEDAERMGYGGKRTLEAAGYLELDKFKNDQFRVVKLQFTSELLSGSTKYTSVILVEDFLTGTVTPLEDLTKEIQEKISALTLQRNASKKAADLAAVTADGVLSQYQNWRVIKVNITTYNVSGPGLGMAQGLTTGVWTYYLEPENLVPSDAASEALLKVLKGNQK
jgi:uncharacterized protein YlxW (UPF0749 family)